MNKTSYDLILVGIMAVITAALRFLPFLVFPEGRKIPKLVTRLSTVLPNAVIAMLVVYCLRNVSLVAYPYAIPELIAIALVILTYIWKKNTLISILFGTVSYMLLIQFVFINT